MPNRNVLTRRLLSQVGRPLFSVGVAGSALLSAGQSSAQQAYFSIEGEITNALGQHQVFFDLPTGATTSDTLFFRTYNNAGLNNAAGDPTQDSDVDPVLDLFSFSAGLSASNDDGATGAFSALDSLLSWPGVADSGGTLPATGLPAADDYRVTFRDFNDDSTGWWGLDAVGPASKLILTQMIPDAANPGGVSVIRSLKFGTTSLDPTPATFDYIGLTDLVITNDLVLNSRALLQHDQGEITVGGTLDININSTYNLAGGTLDLDGDLDIDFGTMNISSPATLDRAAGTSINLNNGGTLVHNPGTVFSGTDLNITGGADASFFGFFGLGTSDDGTISVDGTGSSFTIDSAFNTFWGQNGNAATLNVTNDATASIDFAGGIDFARSTNANSTGVITVNAGGDLTFANTKLTLAEDNSTATATVTVTGTGSTITHTGDKELIVGGTGTGSATINVTDNAVYSTSTGLTTIAATGSVDVTTGGAFNVNGDLVINGGTVDIDATSTFTADGDITINGGTLQDLGVALTLLSASNKNLLVTNGGQVVTNGADTRINRGQTATFQSGGDWTHTGLIVIGSSSGNGTLTFDGSGSQLSVSSALEIGVGSSTAVVNIQNNASATTGSLFVARSNTTPTTDGAVNILSGGTMTTGLIGVGNLDGNRGQGSVIVDGSGSTLTQTGANVLILGNADTPGNNGVHTINVTNSAVFNTGTGTTTIRKTGTLNVSSFGSFKANGDVNLVGGTININTGGGFDLAAGKTVTASAGGQFNFNTGASGYTVFNGTTLNINDDADLLIEAGLFVGFGTNGTLNIDGAGSTLTINNNLNSQFVGRIGPNGSTGVLTLRNGALGTLADEDLWIANFGTGSGTVNVESGADLNLGIIEMSTNDEGTSVINVTGTGSTLTQAGASALTVGSAGTSSATINVTDSGVFNAGTGTTTINANGSVDVTTGGTFNVNGDLVINGGTVDIDATSTFTADGDITIDGGTLQDLGVAPLLLTAGNKNLLVTNGGQVITVGGDTNLRSGQTANFQTGGDWTHTGSILVGNGTDGTLAFDGSGSDLNVSNDLEVAIGSSTGVVNIQNNASATTGSLFVARSSTNATTDGEVNILSGGTMTSGFIGVGNVDGNRGQGSVIVDGSGSTLSQTGGSSLILGNADTPGNGGVHTINVTNNAVFNTGTGTTTINKTGTLNINVDGSGIDGAQFNANGNVNIIGGALNAFVDARDFSLASGRKLTASQGARVYFGDDFEINPGRTLEFNSGADLTVEDYLDIEAGTLIVDGVGTTVTTNTTDDVNTDWADTGAGAVVTIRNGGTYTIQQPAELDLADSFGATLATVRVESGGQMNLHELNLAPQRGGSASLTVTGTGSAITQAGAALLNIGSDEAGATGTGLLVVEESGVFTTGSGAVTVNPTGTIKLDNGTFAANGALTFNGGTLHTVITTGLEPALQADAGATINPDATLKIELDPGLVVAENDSFSIIESANPIASVFNNVEGFIIGDGLYLDQSILNLGGTSTLIVTATMALPGDTDYDGDIDDSDLGTAFANYTGPVGAAGNKAWEDGDTDGDGDVDDSDLGTAFAGYTGPLSPVNVPEPTSLALLAALGGWAGLGRRRRAC
ncbi:MAG: PEP-CTERM sorting domain-containing protein [Phycisphaeraceae bacterium]